jgi:hypothetical protein
MLDQAKRDDNWIAIDPLGRSSPPLMDKSQSMSSYGFIEDDSDVDKVYIIPEPEPTRLRKKNLDNVVLVCHDAIPGAYPSPPYVYVAAFDSKALIESLFGQSGEGDDWLAYLT